MSPEKDKLLCEKFPNLYRDRYAPMNQTCMCWGFDVGDGWFGIIYRLSEKLEPLIEALKGSKDLVENDWLPRVSQVKEKFGTLRFYMYCQTEEMDKFIIEAQKESARTCEDCGRPGELRTRGWWRTLCEICFDDTRKAA